eukprot:403356726
MNNQISESLSSMSPQVLEHLQTAFGDILTNLPKAFDNSHNIPLQQQAANVAVTDSRFSWLGRDQFLIMRWVLFGVNLVFGGQSLYYMDLPNIAHHLSAWSVMMSIFTQGMLLGAYYRDYNPYYDNVVKACYQLSLPMLGYASFGFWGLQYKDQPPVNFKDPSTLYYSVYMHLVGTVVMNIDNIFSAITYDISKGAEYMMFILVSFIPMEYFGLEFIGSSFVDEYELTSISAWGKRLAQIPFGFAFYYAFAYFTNFIKGGRVGISKAQIAKLIQGYSNIQNLA